MISYDLLCVILTIDLQKHHFFNQCYSILHFDVIISVIKYFSEEELNLRSKTVEIDENSDVLLRNYEVVINKPCFSSM